MDVVIAVYLKNNGPHKTPANLFQVIGKAFQIIDSRTEAAWRNDCDVLIEPDVNEFNWDDFSCADEIIRAGERAAFEALPAIRAMMQEEVMLRTAVPVVAG